MSGLRCRWFRLKKFCSIEPKERQNLVSEMSLYEIYSLRRIELWLTIYTEHICEDLLKNPISIGDATMNVTRTSSLSRWSKDVFEQHYSSELKTKSHKCKMFLCTLKNVLQKKGCTHFFENQLKNKKRCLSRTSQVVS